MPQMMPLFWSIMIIYSIMMLFILIKFNYFFYSPMLPYYLPINSNNQNMKWKWKW